MFHLIFGFEKIFLFFNKVCLTYFRLLLLTIIIIDN